MFDEFGNPIDTGLGDPTAGDFASQDVSGGMDLGGMMTVGNIAGGLLGNPGRLASAGAGSLMGMARRGGSILLAGGAKLPVKKAWAAVKKFGPELVAGALGMAATDLISILVSSGAITGGRRRSRGISGRDVSVTRRTCRKLHSIQNAIQACSTRRAPRRSH